MQKYFARLNGWPSTIIGIAMLGIGAYYAFNFYQNLEDERVLLLAELESARASNYELIRKINEKEGVIAAFEGQISSITSTVGTLEKLSKTDEELLAKYSKVYFLNENYLPKSLTVMSERYLNKTATNIEIHTQVWPYLEKLLIDANSDGVKLLVASGYRSFATQSSLKSGYTVIYGTGANKFSADQGYSEHQLGTTVDFTTEKLGSNFSTFGSDSAYQWLLENAYNYGFILSYPAKNTYYKFEPWHWRYVGKELARRLHDDQKFFYDLDQREIETYLVKLFD